jgi:mono/diheme cytochrome c family protein
MRLRWYQQGRGALPTMGAILALALPGCGWTDTTKSEPEAPAAGNAVATPTTTTTASPALFTGTPASLPSNGRPDSYAYYGLGVDPKEPEHYDNDQQQGRDTWIMWTAGNQNFFRLGSQLGGNIGVSIEYFRLLDTRRRSSRFRQLGMINEPNCEEAKEPDEYGFWLDKWDGDPYKGAYPDTSIYGEPTGVVGLRKFGNPKFDKSKWDRNSSPQEYFRNPGKVEPPYLIGMACAFCHMGFHPLRPPADPANPRWENLAANLGNQFLAEGRVFFGEGRAVYGDQNDGDGLHPNDFLYQLGATQQRGTSETSRLSYDFINNPNTMNSIFNLESRPSFKETYNKVAEDQVRRIVPAPQELPVIHHVLKTGEDSQGIPIASIRVYVNIGMFGDYWITKLWNPLQPDQGQTPFDMTVAAAKSPDWNATLMRMPDLEKYLATYRPMRLETIPAAVDKGLVVPDSFRDSTDPAKKARWAQVEQGRTVFADQCARCHSSKPKPGADIAGDAGKVKDYYRNQVAAADFLDGNVLTDDVPYPVSELKENAARALATNATAGHVWDQFSSPEFKARPASGPVALYNPASPSQPREWQPPAGGRGYYRTASLVNIWATAPFLHNNSVGEFSSEIPGLEQPATWVSVEGRLRVFEAAIDALLNPEKRDMGPDGKVDAEKSVKRVSQDCWVYLRLGNLAAVVDDVFSKIELPGDDIGVIRDFKAKIKKDLFGTEPANLANVPLVKILVPKGTPINLIANIHVKNRDKAIQPFLKYTLARKALESLPILGPLGRKGLEAMVRQAQDELLSISEYPDLVENHGHEYGRDLSAADKTALIEYLKKL